ncbi:MAG: hypothetical protein ACRDHK_15290, partial [Actinomycetota bacterium]
MKEPVPEACGWVTLTLASTMVHPGSHTVERSNVIDPPSGASKACSERISTESAVRCAKATWAPPATRRPTTPVMT